MTAARTKEHEEEKHTGLRTEQKEIILQEVKPEKQ